MFYSHWHFLLYLRDTDLRWLAQNWERTSLTGPQWHMPSCPSCSFIFVSPVFIFICTKAPHPPTYEPDPAQGFSLFRDRFTATVRGPPSVCEAPGNDREAGEGDSRQINPSLHPEPTSRMTNYETYLKKIFYTCHLYLLLYKTFRNKIKNNICN